jgi:hypothetical protein
MGKLTRIIQESFEDKLIRYTTAGLLGIAMVAVPYIASRPDPHLVKQVTLKSDSHHPIITLSGYDTDKDGKIDQIKEYQAMYTVKGPIIVEHSYSSQNRRFGELLEKLDEGVERK